MEFNGLKDDPMTPVPLQGYFRSFRLPSGGCVHAFAGGSEPLSTCHFLGRDGGPLSDAERLRLIMDLLDAVNFLHCRGAPNSRGRPVLSLCQPMVTLAYHPLPQAPPISAWTANSCAFRRASGPGFA